MADCLLARTAKEASMGKCHDLVESKTKTAGRPTNEGELPDRGLRGLRGDFGDRNWSWGWNRLRSRR